MFKKVSLVAAAGVGYVLGARAGRERYNTLADRAHRVSEAPQAQAASAKVKEAAPVVAEKVREAASGVKDKVTSRAHRDDDTMPPDPFADDPMPGADPHAHDADTGLTIGALTPDPTRAAPTAPSPVTTTAKTASASRSAKTT